MRHLRIAIVLLSLPTALLAGCGGDGDQSADAPVESADQAAERPESTTTTAVVDLDCSDATTTTSPSTTVPRLPTVCGLIEDLPPERAAEDISRDQIWEGTVSGTLQTPGCDPVSQSGGVLLLVFADGELFGAGATVSGAYSCENGASIPEMTHAYGIDGEMSDTFTLVFSDGVQLTSDQIVDGHARIVQDTGAGAVTIELTCPYC